MLDMAHTTQASNQVGTANLQRARNCAEAVVNLGMSGLSGQSRSGNDIFIFEARLGGLHTAYSSVMASIALLRLRPISHGCEVWEGGTEEACGNGGKGRMGGGEADALSLGRRCTIQRIR